MKIDLITPTFNSEATILRNLNSVSITKNVHRIFVDNLSNDQTLDIIRKFADDKKTKFTIISEKDQGISDAFNKGIKAGKSEIIGILNSDDEHFDLGVISRVLKAFENPDIDFVHGDMHFIDQAHGSNVRAPLMCPLSYAMPFNHPTMFIRRKVYDQVGLFDLSYRYAMDFDLMCRMYIDVNKCQFLGHYLKGDPIVKMHAGGVSWNYELKSIDEVERALKNHGFLDSDALHHLKMRRMRIKLKNVLSKCGLNSLIKVWRNLKWR